MNNNSWSEPSTILNIIMAVLGMFGLLAAVMALRANRDAVDVMREQITASTRPYVIVDFEERGEKVFMTVANTGVSGAHDLNMNFIVPPYNVMRYHIKQGSGPSELATRPIPFLAPGKKLEELIFDPGDKNSTYQEKVTVQLSYKDSSGTAFKESITLAHDSDRKDRWE